MIWVWGPRGWSLSLPTTVMSGMNVDSSRTQWIITCHERVTSVTCHVAPPSALALSTGSDHNQENIMALSAFCFDSLHECLLFNVQGVKTMEYNLKIIFELKTASQAINNVAKPCFDQFDLYQMTSYICRRDRKFKYLRLKLNTNFYYLFEIL